MIDEKAEYDRCGHLNAVSGGVIQNCGEYQSEPEVTLYQLMIHQCNSHGSWDTCSGYVIFLLALSSSVVLSELIITSGSGS